MRVTYKEAIHDADDPKQDLEWLPRVINSEGKRVTDPKGLLFMAENFVADLSMPAPPETWKHGDFSDAEGLKKKDIWKKKKVLSDILLHRMIPFTEEQKDQWRAMNEFHTKYQLSDEVPCLPLALRAGKAARMPLAYKYVRLTNLLLLLVLTFTFAPLCPFS